MKTHPTDRPGLSLTLLCVAFGVAFTAPRVGAAPREKATVRRGIEKVGNFFLQIARRLEQPGFGPEYEDAAGATEYDARNLPRHPGRSPIVGSAAPDATWSSRYGELDGARRVSPKVFGGNRSSLTDALLFVPPKFQVKPQPDGTGARSLLTLPVVPGSVAAGTEASRQVADAGKDASEAVEPDTPDRAAAESVGRAVERHAGVTAQPAVREPCFASPVPGHRGFVYPPGAAHELKSMIDVRGFVAGQKVRDPRTGEVFLVPPN